MFKSIVATLAITATVAAVEPVAAQVMPFDPALKTAGASPLTDVQYAPGYRRYGRGRYYAPGRGGFPVGAGIAAGLAAGAILGGIAASSAAQGQPAYAVPPQGDDDAYCASRFRSYDPSSGTYMGYDGVRRSCP